MNLSLGRRRRGNCCGRTARLQSGAAKRRTWTWPGARGRGQRVGGQGLSTNSWHRAKGPTLSRYRVLSRVDSSTRGPAPSAEAHRGGVSV